MSHNYSAPPVPAPEPEAENQSRMASVAGALESVAKAGISEGRYRISEDGKNGQVTFGDKGLDRVLKKALGKDDRQFIPYTSIAMVSHDRKRLGRDVVVVQVGAKSYSWKIVADAEGFVDRLNQLIV